MRKLLSANLSRLWKSRAFWLGLAAVFGLAVLYMLTNCRVAALDAESGFDYTLDAFYFSFVPFLGVFFSAFISLFLGPEYSDGGLRDKIIAGHSRTDIYLAGLLTCMAGTALYDAACLAGGLAGIPFLGVWQMSAPALMLCMATVFLSSLTLCAIFVLIGFLWENRAAAAVASLLLAIGLILAGSILYNLLCEPEFSSGVVITAEGMQLGDPTPNPSYLAEPLRTVCRVLLNILPTGQAIMLANVAEDESFAMPLLELIASPLLVLGFSAGGAALFHRKDLK